MSDKTLDPEQYRLFPSDQIQKPTFKPKTKWLYKPVPGEAFTKGPIPKWWINIAAGLPGKAAQVGQEIWHQAGLTYSFQVRLNLSRLKGMGISRDSARRGLEQLENANLVRVKKALGCVSYVTLVLVRPVELRQETNFNGNGNESSNEG
jgi:hypothetical protein